MARNVVSGVAVMVVYVGVVVDVVDVVCCSPDLNAVALWCPGSLCVTLSSPLFSSPRTHLHAC